jgi:flavin reductase (DIM6/NTAB) family NADH-FMN oxidoreductase RutF
METKKKETELGFLWHKYAALLVFQTAIVTTFDRSGSVNAAPFSLVYPFCGGDPDKPQMLFSAASVWHTARNIEETGEFVINYAPYALMKQVCETGCFYPDGRNELEKAGLHAVAALKVKPPRIQECYQHIECRLNHILKPIELQYNFIGDVVAISVDEALLDREKEAALKTADFLFYYGGVQQTETEYFAGIGKTGSYTVSREVAEEE